jgi:hypothetical protein
LPLHYLILKSFSLGLTLGGRRVSWGLSGVSALLIRCDAGFLARARGLAGIGVLVTASSRLVVGGRRAGVGLRLGVVAGQGIEMGTNVGKVLGVTWVGEAACLGA